MLQHAATESSLVRRLRREHLIEKKLSQVLEKIGKMKVTLLECERARMCARSLPASGEPLSLLSDDNPLHILEGTH